MVLTLLLAPLVPLGLVAATPADAAVVTPLSTTNGGYDQDVYGDFLLVGNGSTQCPTTGQAGTSAPTQGTNADCVAAQKRPASGTIGINNYYDMRWADVDGDTSTFNSSSASVTLPPGSTVAYAQLAWAGDTGALTQTTNRGCSANQVNRGPAEFPSGAPSTTPVRLKVGSGTYQAYAPTHFVSDLSTLGTTAAQTPEYYSATAVVTDQLRTAPTGVPLTLTVGNVWTPQGYDCFAGWSLTVVYSYATPNATYAPLKRTVQIRNGHVRQFAQNANGTPTPDTTVTLTGLRTVTTDLKIGVTSYEGDYGLSGDDFKVNGTSVADPAGNGPTLPNFFTDYAQGAASPNVPNNLSVDAKSFTTSLVPSGQKTANLTFTTRGDSYLPQSVVVSSPVPEIRATKTAGASVVRAGGSLSFTITVTNPTPAPLSSVLVQDPSFPDCNRNIGTLAGGTTVSYVCTTTAGSSGFVNTATVSGSDTPTSTTVSVNASSQPVTVIRPSIAATKTADKASYDPGQTIIYTIQVKNTGDSDLTAVEVTDQKVAGCGRVVGTLTAGSPEYRYTCTATAGTGQLNGSNTIDVTAKDRTDTSVTASSTALNPLNGSISGRVLSDPGQDGLRTSGIVGARVTLTPLDGQSYATPTVTTISGGAFAFTSVPPGRYTLAEDRTGATTRFPSGLSAEFADGKDTGGTQTSTPGTNSFVVTLGTSGDLSSGTVFTEIPQGSLSGAVFADTNGDGNRAPSEAGISGVTVELSGKDIDGNPVSLTTLTSGTGAWSFTGLRRSDGTGYTVREVQPDYADGRETAGTAGGSTAGTGTSADTDTISGIQLGGTAQATGYLFAELPPSSITGRVDLSTGGPLTGVSVRLQGTDDRGVAVDKTVQTRSDGSFVFAFLRPGTYAVSEVQPGAYGDGGVTSSIGRVVPPNRVEDITLTAATNASGIVFTDDPASVLGVVYSDLNGNGVRDDGEPGIGGSTLRLTRTDASGTTPVVVTTRSDGTFAASVLVAGTYTLEQLQQPDGYLDGVETVGTGGGTRSSTDTITGIVVPAGGTVDGYAFGELKPATLQGSVTVTGAGPLGGVVVRLQTGGATVDTAITDDDGSFSFAGLRPDTTYAIVEEQPTGYTGTTSTAGPAGGSAGADTVTGIRLVGGTTATGYGFVETGGTLSGSVYEDADGDGQRGTGETGISGVVVTLTSSSGATRTVTTGSTGGYAFAGLVPGTYSLSEAQPLGYSDGADRAGTAGGQVASPGDTISQITLTTVGQVADGYLFGEQLAASLSGSVQVRPGLPLAGVDVVLTGTTSTGTVTLTATSGGDGTFVFPRVLPGTYTLTEQQPGQYGNGTVLVPAGQPGTPAQPDTVTTIVLGPADRASGYVFTDPGATLAGRVYEDKDSTGTPTTGDPGIPGATVRLYSGTTLVRETVSDGNGDYRFLDLPADTSYTITETTPAGYLDGRDNAGTVDGTPSGTADGADSITSVALTRGAAGTGYSFSEVKAASLSGAVRLEDGTGVGGVTVTLTGTDDLRAAVTATRTTLPDGTWSFTGLRPGSYTVSETQPSAYGDSATTAGNAGGTVTTNQVSAIPLVSGTTATGYVFTERAGSLSGTVYTDTNRDGVRQGTEPAYTAGPVTLVVTDPAGATRTVTTLADGSYRVDGLPEGRNYSVQVLPPPGTSASSLALLQRDVVAGQATTLVDFGLRPESAPDAVDDARTTRVGTAVTLDVTTNDTDPDVGDPKNVTVTVPPAHGGVTCTLAGSCTYTPATGFTGTDTFTYRLDDGQGLSDTAVVTITVLPANRPPVANPDTATTAGSTPVDVNVLANDSDPDQDVLFVGVTQQPTRGTVSCTTAGLCTYTPTAGLTGPDTFTYQVSDGQGGTATATVTVTVQAGPAVNRAPVAADDTATVAAGASIPVDVLRNDADPDGDPLALAVATQPAQGTVTCSGSTCTYTAAPNATGTDTFTYRISDPAGLSSTATVTVTLSAPVTVNRAPVARDDTATVAPGARVVVPVLGNDTDPDGDPLQVTGSSTPARGTVSCTTTACTYTPTGTTAGTDTFTYTVSDGRGGSATATVTVTVSPTAPVNTPPVAVNDSATTPQDTAVLVPVLRNDTDADADPLTATLLAAPLHGAVVCGASGCTYTPTAGYSGPDAFTYTVSDGRGGTDTARVDVTVTPANQPPVAVDDTATTPAATAVVVPVTANDTDADGGSLTAAVATQPAHGVVTCTGTTCRYTPTTGFTGTDTFTYTVSDGQGGSDVGTVTVTVTSGPAPADRAPVANPDSRTTPQGQAVVVPVTANDTDPDGDALTASSPTAPAHGTAVCSGTSCTYTPDPAFTGQDTFTYTVSDGTLTSTALVTITVTPVDRPVTAVDDVYSVPSGTATVLTVVSNDTDPDNDPLTAAVRTQPGHGVVTCSGGACTYTPTGGYTGPDSFTYTVSDGRGSTDVGTVSLTVTPPAANQPPVVQGETATTPQGTPVAVTVSAGDSDPDGGTLTWAAGPKPAHGTVSCTSAGVCTYTPDAGFSGTDTFTYVVSDGQGGSTPGSVTVTVTPAAPGNQPPVVQGETATTPQGTPVAVTVSAGDSDPDGGTLTWAAGPKPAHGTVSCTSAGVCTYTPDAGFSGTDTFTYVVFDGQGGSTPGTVTVTVTPAPAGNRPPVVQDETATTPQASAVAVTVSTNDSDPDGDALRYVEGPKPAHGTVSCTSAGVCTYTPDAGFTGTDTFTYVVSDGRGGSTTGTVTVTVTNAPPVARDDQYTVPTGSTTVLPVLGNDSDAGGGPVQVVSSTAPATGTVTCAAGTSCTYTAPAGLTAPVTVSFNYTVEDSGGLRAVATVTVTVVPGTTGDLPPAFTPVAANTQQTVPVGGALAPVVASDPDDTLLTYTVDPRTLPPGVSGIDPRTGAFVGTPTTPGVYGVVVTVTDPAGGTDTTTVTVTVTDRAPVAVDDSATTPVGTAVLVPVLANDTDGDPGQTLTVVSVGTPSSGLVSCTAAGDCTVTPPAGSTAPVVFTYTVSDGFGGQATATVTVTITATPVPSPTTPAPSPTTPAPSPTSPAPSPTSPSVSPSPSPSSPAPSPTSPAPSPTTPVPSPTSATPTAAANRPPVAGDDRATTPAGTAVTILVLGNDTDPDGDPLAVSVTTRPAHGTVTCTTAGCRYTPAAGFSGTDTFTYTVDDGRGGRDTATVTVTVTPPAANRPPVARDDADTTPAGTPVVVDVLANDTDPDGNPLTAAVASQPAHGTVTCTASGCRYTPDAGYTGTDTFTYTVSDGKGGTDTATATITVQPRDPGTGGGGDAGDADGDGIPNALDPTPYGTAGTPGGSGTGNGSDPGVGTGSGPGGRLARTGSDLGLMGGTGLALVLAGGLLLLVVRPTRRRLVG